MLIIQGNADTSRNHGNHRCHPFVLVEVRLRYTLTRHAVTVVAAKANERLTLIDFDIYRFVSLITRKKLVVLVQGFSGSDRTDEFATSLCRLINEEWSDASSTGISSSQSSIESGMKTSVGT